MFHTPWKTLRVSHTAHSPDDDVSTFHIKEVIPRPPHPLLPGGPRFDDQLAPFSMIKMSEGEREWPPFRLSNGPLFD